MTEKQNHKKYNFLERRHRLCQLAGSGLLIVANAETKQRNADCNYPYRADSYFLYLTGFEEPDSILLLDASQGKSIFFCREKQIDREIWDGFRFGPEAAREEFNFDLAYPISEFYSRLPELLKNHKQISWLIGKDADFDKNIFESVKQSIASYKSIATVPNTFNDLKPLLDAMRLIKDEKEIELLCKAGEISALAHRRAMLLSNPGLYEYQLEAEILHVFVQNGARFCAYESIVAAGRNACTLHYVGNSSILNNNEMILIDAGCELSGYAGDISRTFPVNGVFSASQRAVYEIVLEAQLSAIEATKIGISLDVPRNVALRILVQGMIDLGLLTGSVDSAIESGAYKRFYMHGLGHWLGLDVHDVGMPFSGSESHVFQVGMCMTVEPGLYIRAADDIPKEFHNIGIRIEDDLLIGEKQNYIYTSNAPKKIKEIEDLMRG